MQSVDNTEMLNTETDKIAKLIETTTQLNKCLLSVVEQLKNITSQPVELTYQTSRYRPISPCEERLYPRRNGTFEKTRCRTISHDKGS